jgi:hypothetical protein
MALSRVRRDPGWCRQPLRHDRSWWRWFGHRVCGHEVADRLKPETEDRGRVKLTRHCRGVTISAPPYSVPKIVSVRHMVQERLRYAHAGWSCPS